MKWTKEKPTKPGWYWTVRIDPKWGEGPMIIKLRDYGGKLCHINWPPFSDGYLWAGPIPEPEGE